MIRIERLSVSYDKKRVLDLNEMVFPDGTVTSVLGKNGSGKSTFLRTVAGVLPYGGRVEVEGRELCTIPFSKKARVIGYLPQSLAQPDMTVSMLVAHGRFPWKSFPRKLNEQDLSLIKDAMGKVGVLPLAEKNLKEISGGELKLSYLAMLLAQGTDALLLDEPDAHLDMEHQQLLFEILKDIAASGKTVILTSHDLVKSMNYSDRIYVFQNGGVALAGTPTEVAEKKEELSSIMGASVVESKQSESLYRYIYGR